MRKKVATFSILLSATCFAKSPPSPLFHLQFWAQNPGGLLTTDNPIGSGKVVKFATKAGIDLNLTKAWDISTGSKSVIVGIVDDGFELNHENYTTPN